MWHYAVPNGALSTLHTSELVELVDEQRGAVLRAARRLMRRAVRGVPSAMLAGVELD
jgi:hypothetical protein